MKPAISTTVTSTIMICSQVTRTSNPSAVKRLKPPETTCPPGLGRAWLIVTESLTPNDPLGGDVGRLLDNMLGALGIKRGEGAYIANAVKCRPPGNRTPEHGEMGACHPFLEKKIRWLKPKIIVLLGRAAVYSVLKEDRALGSLRQQRFSYQDIPVVVTYHPAYLLRNLVDKSKAWEDLVFARHCLRA